MAECDGLDKIFVKAEKPSYGPGYFGNELDMEYAVGYVVVFDHIKDLGLVYISRVSAGVQDAVGIKCEILAMSATLFCGPAQSVPAPGRIGREQCFFATVKLFPEIGKNLLGVFVLFILHTGHHKGKDILPFIRRRDLLMQNILT